MLLLEALVATAAAVGISGHHSAKKKNEQAQQKADEAQRLYNSGKASLESSQNAAKNALVKLGSAKKNVMDGTIAQFLTAYDRIKDVQLKGSIGLNEAGKLTFASEDAVQLREMSDLYSSSMSSGVAGAVTGSLVALAASGSLPVLAGGLELAGTVLTLGEVGAAIEIAGSTLSLGIALTPLSAIAAPVVLFTGISASMKADENLEKAETMYAEARAACEKMAIARTVCNGILERSNMFTQLLEKLNPLYAPCVRLLDAVTAKKNRKTEGRTLSSDDFTEEEMRLIAVTHALTKAIKAVIDTPILTADGSLSKESQMVYDDTLRALPEFAASAKKVQRQISPLSKLQFENISLAIRGVHSRLLSVDKTHLKRGIAAAAALCVVFILASAISHRSTQALVPQNEQSTTIVAAPQIAEPSGASTQRPVETIVQEFNIESLVGTGYLKSRALYFIVFEKSGTYYFNFVISNGKYNHLTTPVPIFIEGEFAVAEYDDDNCGNSGTVWFSQGDNGTIYMSGRVNDSNTSQYTSSGEYNALIMDDEPVYYDEEICDYPIYKEYLAS